MHNHSQPARRPWYTSQLTSTGHLYTAADPTRHNHQLKLVLRGATKAHCLNKPAVRHKRQPITCKLRILHLLLRRHKNSRSYNKHDKHMLSTAFTLAFYYFFRVSELTHKPHIHRYRLVQVLLPLQAQDVKN